MVGGGVNSIEPERNGALWAASSLSLYSISWRMRQNLESFFMVCARSGLEACENKMNIHHLKYSALLYYIKVNVFHRLVTLLFFFFFCRFLPTAAKLSLHKETITHRYLITPSLLTRVFWLFHKSEVRQSISAATAMFVTMGSESTFSVLVFFLDK